jgi:hypothetical protein
MTDRDLFGGAPVVAFRAERDRRSFIKWAAIVGVGGSLAAAARDRFAVAQGARGDIDVLNYALTLEYLERDFFARGVDSGLLSGRTLALIEPVLGHESDHVAALSGAVESLGGSVVDEPSFDYPAGTFRDLSKWLTTAADLEDLAVKAYHGQVTNIRNPELLGAAASIAGTESRHAAILAELAGRNPFPAPIEGAVSRARALEAARPFIEP